jgi:integrase
MLVRDHDGDYGRKVWLSAGEVTQLLDAAEDTTQRIAFGLGARCGLRSAEVLGVAPEDVHETEIGTMLSVDGAKGGGYRETPMSSDLATTIRTADDYRDAPSDAPLVDVTTRTLRRWVESAADELAETTDDARWRELSFHDLRRTWATNLGGAEVDPLVVCDWGGWTDLDVFLEHYRGTYSPDAQRRERSKVEWL